MNSAEGVGNQSANEKGNLISEINKSCGLSNSNTGLEVNRGKLKTEP
jgi:hypothetical protein